MAPAMTDPPKNKRRGGGGRGGRAYYGIEGGGREDMTRDKKGRYGKEAGGEGGLEAVAGSSSQARLGHQFSHSGAR